jgi:hypothetical protein
MQEPQVASQDTTPDLITQAKAVLSENDRGGYTVPSEHLYPHQWLWDSCFISMGLRHYDIVRAQTEILSLFRGQWSNGMLPNIIFSNDVIYHGDRELWRSKLNPYSPDHVSTSGITQPPVLAEAIVRVGDKLPLKDRRAWYKMVLPALMAYHTWLYEDRDPHNEGLVLQIHPWETGSDNTPPWMAAMHDHLMPWWIRAIEKLRLDSLMTLARRDTHYVPIKERYSNIEGLVLYDAQRRLRRKGYNINKILDHSLFAIEDLMFNSILIRNNELLRYIAKSIREELPEELLKNMSLTIKTLEELWDPYSNEYYSRDFITHELLKEPSVAALMPLYAGSITKERAEQLVKILENKHVFGTKFPVPSVPTNSAWFDPLRYWQGPTWVNTNWLIIDGLRRYGFDGQANSLTTKTIEMIESGGLSEYFNPLNGRPLGIKSFSWTAALYIDLKKVQPKKAKTN